MPANKQTLINEVTKVLQLEKKAEGALVVDAVINAITNSIMEEGSLQLSGFGVFKVQKRDAYEGINPMTREKIQVSARKSITFKAGKSLKEMVNASKAKTAAPAVKTKKVVAKKKVVKKK